MMTPETERELREIVADGLCEYLGASGDVSSRMDSFAEAGLFTNNEGLVIRFSSGAEFQLTIVRSR